MIGRNGQIAATALIALALASCGEGEQPLPAQPVGLPAEVCKEAREALEELSKTGSFEYSADGTANMEEAAWLPMAPGQRDALSQAIGFHAACSAPEPARETSITIKNEAGRVLTQRVVETSADLSRILKN